MQAEGLNWSMVLHGWHRCGAFSSSGSAVPSPIMRAIGLRNRDSAIVRHDPKVVVDDSAWQSGFAGEQSWASREAYHDPIRQSRVIRTLLRSG